MNDERFSISNQGGGIKRPWLKYYTEEAIHGELPAMTICQYLWEHNRNHLNRIALNYFDKKITYGELFDKIHMVSQSLISYGIKKDDIVTIVMPSTPEAIYLFYALSELGAVANMVDPRSSKEELEHYVKEVNSKLLFTIDAAACKFKEIKQKTTVEDVITISPADSMPLGLALGYKAKSFFENMCSKDNLSKELGFTKWHTFIKKGKMDCKTVEKPAYERDKTVVIVHTGGTTGVPKGVMLSNDNINIATYDCIHAGFDFQRKHKWLNIMPPFIAYGVGNGLHLPLVVGMEVILIPQFNPEKFDKLLIKYKPNHMTGVPSHYKSLLYSKRLENEDLSYWRSAIVGGDGMKIELEQQVNEFLQQHNCHEKIKKGYGMSEVTAAVAACPSNECNAIGSVGIPFPHSIIGIFDPNTGKELPYGEIGEVRIQTPNRMLGYFENSEEEAKVVKKHADGSIWVHSGDLGYMTADGLLFIEGRMKNMIIRHDGFKVYPKRIEDTIMKHPAVESCMVVGIDDLDYAQGKLPKVYVTIKKDISISGMLETNFEAELEMLCKKLLPEYSQPAEFAILDNFPLTKIGKFDYVALTIQACEERKIKLKTKGKQLQYRN